MFEENICRWNALEIFQLDRSVTDLKSIRERESVTRDDWKFNDHKIKLRNGELHALEEARLNEFQNRIDNPIRRLQEERYVHQVHSFAGDEELLTALNQLVREQGAAEIPMVGGSALVSAIGGLLPTVTPPCMEDDLPWPDLPKPMHIDDEPLETAILRDC
jgi:hypothetical protein